MAGFINQEYEKLYNRVMEVEGEICDYYGIIIKSGGVECPKCGTHKLGFFIGKNTGHLKCKCSFCNFVGDVIDLVKLKDKRFTDLEYPKMLKILIDEFNPITEKEQEEKKEIYRIARANLYRDAIYINVGADSNGTGYGINITRSDGKSLFDYFYQKDFLELLNEHFEVPFKDFDEFLDTNNFRMLFGNSFLEISNLSKDENSKGNKNLYITGLNNFIKLFALFLGMLLSEYIKAKKIIVEKDTFSKIDFNLKIDKNLKLKNDNLITVLKREITDKEKDDELIRFIKLSGVSEYQSSIIQIILTKVYKALENRALILKDEYKFRSGIFEMIENIKNPAYLALKYGLSCVTNEDYVEISYNAEKYRIYFTEK